MFRKGVPYYSLALHGILVLLAASTMILSTQVRRLERQLLPPEERLPWEAGEAIEPFPVAELDGTPTLAPSAARDDHEELLFFFTTTCPACKENQKQWKELHRRLGDQVQVVGVSLDPTEPSVAYREAMELPYRVVTVADRQAFAQEHELSAVPLTVHLGADGKVLHTRIGILSDQDVTDILARSRVASSS
ncbi:MAG: TlpA family protein disulfide reductase [Acidobacteria bacterium]|nr:TlpA family protein disulfide reductase [Acidobacteriota bacterium]